MRAQSHPDQIHHFSIFLSFYSNAGSTQTTASRLLVAIIFVTPNMSIIWIKKIKKNFLTHIRLFPGLKPKLYSRGKNTHTIHKLFLSVSLNAYIYTSHTQVCTQKRCSSPSTLLSKKSGSTLMCEWRCAPPPLSVPPSLTIHKHHSTACCLMWKLHPHFLSAWEIFFFCGGP